MLCQLGVCTKFNSNIVIYSFWRTTRLPKERWMDPSQKWNRPKSRAFTRTLISLHLFCDTIAQFPHGRKTSMNLYHHLQKFFLVVAPALCLTTTFGWAVLHGCSPSSCSSSTLGVLLPDGNGTFLFYLWWHGDLCLTCIFHSHHSILHSSVVFKMAFPHGLQ